MSEFNVGRLEFDPDRRQHTRAAVASDVVMEFSGQEYVLVAQDVSAGGLAASHHREIHQTSEGTATFALSESEAPLSCRCRVIYSLEGRGIGVEFLDLSEESRQALKKFVDASN